MNLKRLKGIGCSKIGEYWVLNYVEILAELYVHIGLSKRCVVILLYISFVTVNSCIFDISGEYSIIETNIFFAIFRSCFTAYFFVVANCSAFCCRPELPLT